MKGMAGLALAVVFASALTGCGPTITHRVEPIEVTVTVKIDRSLEDFFQGVETAAPAAPARPATATETKETKG